MAIGRRYCLVSPCRDEAEYMPRTIASVVAQSERPVQWIIVDDGSTDETPELLRAACADNDWIHVVRREDRGRRKVGPGVVDAFYSGYEAAAQIEWDYVCKFDMDLEVPPTYFASLMDKMEQDPRLGSASGMAYYPDPLTGRPVREDLSFEMSAGMTKFYRKRCFLQIGGLVRGVMWDGIDCHRARMLGWRARAFDEAALHFMHLRPMGTSHRGIWTGRRRHGYGQYFMGTCLAYATASATRRIFRRPFLIGGMAMWWGYVSSALRREPRLEDPAFRKFLRRYQWLMLFLGKQRATERVESQLAKAWLPERPGPWPAEDPSLALTQ